MSQTIPEITQKYIGDQSLEKFAKTIGIDASRQMVWYWKEGKQVPSIMTLFRVMGSATSTTEAKAWARECINSLQAQAGMEFEDTLDKEVERRR